MNELLEKIGLVLLSTALGWWIGDWNRRRIEAAQLVREVGERYIKEVTEKEPFHSPKAFRIGAMQRAGVALLEKRNYFIPWKTQSLLDRFFDHVTRRGCPHPLANSDIDEFVKIDRLPQFLHEASRQGINLGDDISLYDFLMRLHILVERDKAKSNNGAD